MNSTATNNPIEIHIRTYRSILKATGSLKIDKIIDSHHLMKAILHEKGDTRQIDIAAFIYCLLRLPSCISKVKNIILGQSFSVFKNARLSQITRWQEMDSPGRRRKMLFDGKNRLAVYIASVTDVDDMVTLLTAFQIEWNKLHEKLSGEKNIEDSIPKILAPEDIGRIQNIWGKEYPSFLNAIKQRKVAFEITLLSGSYVEYAKSTSSWWKNIVRKLHGLNIQRRPMYFVSSNTHSLLNLITRFALKREQELISYLYKSANPQLISLWEKIEKGEGLANREYFLYYIAKKYAGLNPDILKVRKDEEKRLGIYSVPAGRYLDIDAQVVEIKKLIKQDLIKSFGINPSLLEKSDAVILNIDYPLGWAAYQVLVEIGQNVDKIKGVYIMGKAATLNGDIGDIMIPGTIFDAHTKNTYVINNLFSQKDFPDFKTGKVLDHQKSISTKGTFFANHELIRNWFEQDTTVVEMEGGPYLNAVYEFIYYNRYEENQFVSLLHPPFDLGVVHYASDTPYSKAKNLGVRNLSYEGVEPTYAISKAILKKIFEKEINSS